MWSSKWSSTRKTGGTRQQQMQNEEERSRTQRRVLTYQYPGNLLQFISDEPSPEAPWERLWKNTGR
jgi:hypothetical protein